MSDDDLYLPPLPPNSAMETNLEALMDLIENQQFSFAVKMYHRFGFDENDRPYWGYCVELACNDFTNESLLLIWSEEEGGIERKLLLVPRGSMYTWRHAELFYNTIWGSFVGSDAWDIGIISRCFWVCSREWLVRYPNEEEPPLMVRGSLLPCGSGCWVFYLHGGPTRSKSALPESLAWTIS